MKDNNWESENRELVSFLRREMNNLIPVGAIQAFAMEEAPDGWLVCDGTEYSITEDTRGLFDMIGNTFGGDSVTSFCVPNLRGQFIRGWDMDGDIDPERELGSYQEDALQGHGHSINPSIFKIEASGSHSHKTKYYSYSVGSWGSDKIVYEVRSSTDSFTSEAGTSTDGSHTHNIEINTNKIPISEILPTQYGQIKCDIETRPKNVVSCHVSKVG